jgi:hypothetical protein
METKEIKESEPQRKVDRSSNFPADCDICRSFKKFADVSENCIAICCRRLRIQMICILLMNKKLAAESVEADRNRISHL